MPVSHYSTIVGQLRADWQTVLPGAVVRFGRPRVPITHLPQVIVLTDRERGFGGQDSGLRSPEERFGFTMEVRVATTDVSDDWEEDLHGIADTFIDLVTGGTSTEREILDTKASAPYAGVCHGYDVTSVEMVDVMDATPYVAMVIRFEVATVVYQ